MSPGISIAKVEVLIILRLPQNNDRADINASRPSASPAIRIQYCTYHNLGQEQLQRATMGHMIACNPERDLKGREIHYTKGGL
jgi:hypothetical protein